MKLYTFRTVRLSIISSLFTVYSAIVCVIQVCRQLSSWTNRFIISSLFTVYSAIVCVIQVCRQLSSWTNRFVDSFRPGPSWSCSKAVYKPVWHILLLSVQWINSWWWTEELSETCRVSWQNKFVKLVHLVGFITKKFAVPSSIIYLHTVHYTFVRTVLTHSLPAI